VSPPAGKGRGEEAFTDPLFRCCVFAAAREAMPPVAEARGGDAPPLFWRPEASDSVHPWLHCS
jgi:hypothetical protein